MITCSPNFRVCNVTSGCQIAPDAAGGREEAEWPEVAVAPVVVGSGWARVILRRLRCIRGARTDSMAWAIGAVLGMSRVLAALSLPGPSAPRRTWATGWPLPQTSPAAATCTGARRARPTACPAPPPRSRAPRRNRFPAAAAAAAAACRDRAPVRDLGARQGWVEWRGRGPRPADRGSRAEGPASGVAGRIARHTLCPPFVLCPCSGPAPSSLHKPFLPDHLGNRHLP